MSYSMNSNNINNNNNKNKQLYENIYNNLKEYMFYPEVIQNNMNMDYHNITYNKQSNDKQSNHNDKQSNHNDKQSNHNDKQSNHNDKQSNHNDKQSNHNDKQSNHNDKQSNHNDKQSNHNDKQSNHNDKQSNIKQSKPQLSNNNVSESKEEDKTPFFIPQEKDKLFWSLFIFINGEYEYKMVQKNANTFSIEKKWKIDTLEKLKEKDVIDFLKLHKIKSADLEDELMNKERLSLKGLQLFCMIYKLSIIYVSGRKYCEFIYKSGTPPSSPELQQYSDIADNSKTFVIMNMPNKEDGIYRNPDEAYIKNIRDTYWKMENVHKPLKGVSAYSLHELQEICSKMEIALEDKETKKKKTMKVLYQELLSHF